MGELEEVEDFSTSRVRVNTIVKIFRSVMGR